MVLPPGVISNAANGGNQRPHLVVTSVPRRSVFKVNAVFCQCPRQSGLYSVFTVSTLTVVCVHGQCTRLCSTVSALDRILCSRYPVWCSVCMYPTPDRSVCTVSV